MRNGRKAFWDSIDEIDVALYADALCGVFRFSLEEDSIPLFLECVEPERSDAVKTCVVRASLTLSQEVCYMHESGWATTYNRIFRPPTYQYAGRLIVYTRLWGDDAKASSRAAHPGAPKSTHITTPNARRRGPEVSAPLMPQIPSMIAISLSCRSYLSGARALGSRCGV